MQHPTDVTDSPPTEREEIQDILVATIRTVRARIEDYDPDSPEEEQLYIRWVRTLGYLSGQYRKLVKDADIDEMQADLDLVQAALEATEDGEGRP